MRALMWFRNDLRTRDNTALTQATSLADDGVVAVFCACHLQWRDHDWGAAKADFVLRNVESLGEQLARLDIPLKVISIPRFRDVPASLLELANEVGAEALFFNREYEINERRRDEAVTSAFKRRGIHTHDCHDQTVVPPDQLRTGSDRFYTVFSPFRNKWVEHVKRDMPLRLSRRRRSRQKIEMFSDRVPDVLPGFDLAKAPRDLWPAGETEAVRRLKRFTVDKLGTYHRDRDTPSAAGTSALSPYLACGVISPRQCLRAALDANENRLDRGKKGSVAWISELVWREFYRHVMWGYPRICMNQPFRPEGKQIKWQTDEEAFARWCRGQTGVPIVDAAMRQLLQTGWMHNRLRMIVAMYLTKHLLVDWRKGEHFFMEHLVDGDLANNNGGWQWSASTGTDAAPYFRIFNPYIQGKRFDSGAKFVFHYCPELRGIDRGIVHDPERWPKDVRNSVDYPKVMIRHGEARARAMTARLLRASSWSDIPSWSERKQVRNTFGIEC